MASYWNPSRFGVRLAAMAVLGLGLFCAHPASFGQPTLSASGQTRLEKVPAKIASPPPSLPSSSAPVAVAFLVNGYTGCCIPPNVKTFLESKGATVYVGNWNDLERKRNPGSFNPGEVFNSTDEYFIKQMQDAIKKIPESTSLILIGHSFGGDAVLQVAKRINGRRIAFLGVLDAVGRGGLRKNATSPVPSNVDCFFNRWQQNSPLLPSEAKGRKVLPQALPFDSNLSGELRSSAREKNQGKQNTEKSAKCETKYRDPLKAIPQLLEHSEVPNDGCIQAKMIEALNAKIF